MSAAGTFISDVNLRGWQIFVIKGTYLCLMALILIYIVVVHQMFLVRNEVEKEKDIRLETVRFKYENLNHM